MEDHAPFIERAFDFAPREESYAVEEVEGRVPEFVRGTYYLNGPARFSRGRSGFPKHAIDQRAQCRGETEPRCRTGGA